MSDLHEPESRLVRVPLQGTKLSFLVAGLFLIAGLYWAFVPIRVPIANGSFWECNSAFTKPAASDGGGFCGSSNEANAAKALALGAAALLTAVGGYQTFGAETRLHEVRARRGRDDAF